MASSSSGEEVYNNNETTSYHRIAIIGGGITGACAASTLVEKLGENRVRVDVFDQGRSGVGGRSSHRNRTPSQNLRWDHGCQFFRGDTPRFQKLVQSWMEEGIVEEWKGTFTGEEGVVEFFGLPSQPPFYVGVGGMDAIQKQVLSNDHNNDDSPIRVYTGTRVSSLKQNTTTQNKWTLYGVDGTAAYHDSAESTARVAIPTPIGRSHDYDAVIVTDLSSSFESWHRASAGLPDRFCQKVRQRAGSRTPLFSCMIAFERPLDVSTSAATVWHDDIWFVARTKDKPGMNTIHDCWTIVSTPKFAIRLIEETPMQDPMTGEFLPQENNYLTTIPGAQLESAFRQLLCEGRLSGGKLIPEEEIPKTLFLDAQRWGSALPAARHLNPNETGTVLSGVSYDFCPNTSFAPTQMEKSSNGDDEVLSFVADTEQMLFQAGDMVSTYTPGFEGAALSGIDASEYLSTLLLSSTTENK